MLRFGYKYVVLKGTWFLKFPNIILSLLLIVVQRDILKKSISMKDIYINTIRRHYQLISI
jgi:hypothetical protein